jgi:hypothetical protein
VSSRWTVVALLALTFLAFVPALANDFALDDTLARSTTNGGKPDRLVAELHSPTTYFTTQYWHGEEQDSRLYRPVTIYSYALTYNLIAKPLLAPESEALPHHMINLLLNVWATWLVLWFMLSLGVGRFGALLTAALFGVHALHSEVVAGIVGRAELLSFCFGMAALQCFRRADSSRPSLWIGLSALSMFAAFGSKESGIAWVGFLPCWVLGRALLGGESAAETMRRNAVRMLLVTVPALGLFLTLRHGAIEALTDSVAYQANPLYYADWSTRLMTAIELWGYGLYKCVVPISLSSQYGIPSTPLVATASNVGFLGALAIALIWLGTCSFRPIRRPLLCVSAAAFFGFGFITSNVPFAIGTMFGERLFYAPSLGVCMLPAILLPHLPVILRRALITVCAAWLIGCITIDWQRSPDWRDNQTLILADVEANPNCAVLQLKAANVRRFLMGADSEQRELHARKSWEHLRLAQKLDPDYVLAFRTESMFLSDEGKKAESLAVIRHTVKMRRLEQSQQEANVRAALGAILVSQPETHRAGVDELRRAVELRPRELSWRLLLLQNAKGILTPGGIRDLLVEGQKHARGHLGLMTMQADYLAEHGGRGPENDETIVQLLGTVFGAVPKERLHGPMFIRARLQFANSLANLGRKEDARRNYEFVTSASGATAAQKAQAQLAIKKL